MSVSNEWVEVKRGEEVGIICLFPYCSDDYCT